jgi:hypothetical protein
MGQLITERVIFAAYSPSTAAARCGPDPPHRTRTESRSDTAFCAMAFAIAYDELASC